MNAFLHALAMWQIDFLLLATLLLAAAIACRLTMRRPASRVALAWGTWLGIAALAVLTALPAWPRYPLAELVQVPDAPPAEEPVVALSESQIAPEPFIIESPPLAIEQVDLSQLAVIEPTPVSSEQSLSWQPILGAAWLVVVALATGWILIGLWQARRLLATAVKAPEWIQAELRRIVSPRGQSPSLLSSGRLTTAVALGAVRPKIVLPQTSIAESNAPAVRAALAHEWAHIRHGDLWLLALERLLVPLLAVHPLFWWLRRSVRLDQELLADAAAAGEEPAEYAQALLVWARTATRARPGLAALSMWENPNTLSRRVSMILDPKRPLARPVNRLWMASIIAAIVPAIVGLSLVTLRPLTAQDDNAPPVATAATVVVDQEADPGRAPVIAPAVKFEAVTLVELELVAMSVNREKLAAADTTLEDAIAEATQSRCRKELGVVVAEVTTDEVTKLVDGLKAHDALQILSRPRVITIDGKEASVRIGGEVPVLRLEESVNGRHEQRVQYREFGTRLIVRPRVPAEESPQSVTLDLMAEQTNVLPLDPKAKEGIEPGDVPSFATFRIETSAETKIGRCLLVAHSPSKSDRPRKSMSEQFMVVVIPQKVQRTLAPVAHHAAATSTRPAQDAPAPLPRESAAQTRASEEQTRLEEALKALHAERDARAKESEALKRQVEALQRDLAKLRDATTAQSASQSKPITTVFVLRHRRAQDVGQDLRDLLEKSKAAERGIQVAGDDIANRLIVRADEQYADEIKKLIEALDRPAKSDPEGRINDYASALQQRLNELRRQRAAAGGQSLHPPHADPVPRAHAQRNWGVLMADVAEARLDLERAQKEFARIEQLKASKAVSQEQFEQKQYELERAKIQLDRAQAQMYAAWPVAEPVAEPAAAPRSDVSQQTEARLLELDLAEAKLAVEAAESELAYVQEIEQKSPGSLTQQEIRKHKLQADRAKIQMQKIMVRIEAARQPRNQQQKEPPDRQ